MYISPNGVHAAKLNVGTFQNFKNILFVKIPIVFFIFYLFIFFLYQLYVYFCPASKPDGHDDVSNRRKETQLEWMIEPF